MRYGYTEHGGGERFLGQDDLFPHPALGNFILAYGADGLDALPDGNEQVQELIDQLVQAGLLEKDEQGGGVRLTPRMVRGMQHRAMLEIFRDLRAGVREGHPSMASGRGGERTDGTRPYQFGDPIGELAIHETLRNAVRRLAEETGGAGPLAPLRLSERDFEVHNTEAMGESALCVLIDLSGSMARYGRHIAAKKVALGLTALVRQRFPNDTVDFIGFSSVAEPLREADLPLVMPKPITTHHWQVRVRVPLDQAELTHPHFTNLHHALQLARQTLRRRGAPNKQIFVVTDGQPTAHLSGGPETGGQILNLIYPPSPVSEEATLAEALRCSREGIRLSSFALIEEYEGLDWVGFVERMTRLTRGVAFYCAAGDLPGTIIESYLAGKRRRSSMGA